MTSMRRMVTSDSATVSRLSVKVNQTAFVEPIVETLADSAPKHDNFVIEDENTVIGFFQIDGLSGKQKIPDSLEVHEVMVDTRHQGKGHGKAFLLGLRPFLQIEYPEWRFACLGVNCRNLKAIRLYEFGGFVDTGKIYSGGASGPQHIMRLDLT